MANSYYRDNYVVSSHKEFIQLERLNAARESDVMWWTQRLPEDTLQKLVDNSLCFGVYHLPDGTTPDQRL